VVTVRGLDVALFMAITAIYVLALWGVLPRSPEKHRTQSGDRNPPRK
jgi:hypothetical protein